MAAFCRLEAAVRASEVHKKHVWHYNLQPPGMCMHHAPSEEKASSQVILASPYDTEALLLECIRDRALFINHVDDFLNISSYDISFF